MCCSTPVPAFQTWCSTPSRWPTRCWWWPRPEPTSLTDAYATIKVLATTQGRRNLRLLVNQTQRVGEGRAIRGQLQQVLDRFVSPALADSVKLELLGEVPLDPAVRESILNRRLLMETLPGTPAAQAIVAAATRLVGSEAG